MRTRPNNSRDIADDIRRRAFDISKGDIQLHNQSCFDQHISPKPPAEWSFGVLAENSGNDRLQKIYDLYQRVFSQSKAGGQAINTQIQVQAQNATAKPQTAEETVEPDVYSRTVPLPSCASSVELSSRRSDVVMDVPSVIELAPP